MRLITLTHKPFTRKEGGGREQEKCKYFPLPRDHSNKSVQSISAIKDAPLPAFLVTRIEIIETWATAYQEPFISLSGLSSFLELPPGTSSGLRREFAYFLSMLSPWSHLLVEVSSLIEPSIVALYYRHFM